VKSKHGIKKTVRDRYAQIARTNSSCCDPATCKCTPETNKTLARRIGYSEEDLEAVPENANLGLGCGNPVALASLKQGETVLDLGSGAGFDCFLAAKRVGETGHVIGVDMTPEMVAKAKANAQKGGYRNVEFRLGEIENLPVPDNSVDVVISNCVINLSPDKKRVFQEAFRVLKPGGRLALSDIVTLSDLPNTVKSNVQAYVGCISGAETKNAYLRKLREAGFQNIIIIDENPFHAESMLNTVTANEMLNHESLTPEDIKQISGSVVSIKLQASKPE
jgi:SAM-dependent methyltransferase